MDWNFFKKKPAQVDSKPVDIAMIQLEALKRVIAEKRKEDPLIGAKIGGHEIVQRLLQGFKDERGVHIESVLCALGSLAGYSCQAAVRAEFCEIKHMPESQVFVIVEGANGETYFFGDMLNKPLAESQYSIWSLAAGAAEHLGAASILDVHEIFKHVSETVGSDTFGVPRIPDKHTPGDRPVNFVKHLWPSVMPHAKDFCESPAEWPMMFGFAIQEVMTMGKEVISPTLALTIVMESAVPMSKLNLGAR